MNGSERSTLKFGEFELDEQRHELRRGDRRVRVQEQPFQILVALLERPGEIVSREAVRDRLWPKGTFVEFEKSINVAVMKLRNALGDSTGEPRYIETVPRLGYRFIAPVEGRSAQSGDSDATRAAERALLERLRREASELRAQEWQLAPSTRALPQLSDVPHSKRATSGLLVAALLLVVGAVGFALWRRAAPDSPAPVISVAVLPFADLSPQAEPAFAAVFTARLTERLTQIPGMQVIAPSPGGAPAAPSPLPARARRLGVGAVVEGSVARDGSQVRVAVQVVNAASELHVWAERYERKEEELPELAGEIAGDLARALGATTPTDGQ